MSRTMLQHPAQNVNGKRFVSPLSEYEQGRRLYNAGKPITACVTDDMTDGYLDAEAAGEDAYWRCMMAQAAH